jgi:hypothetical protein
MFSRDTQDHCHSDEACAGAWRAATSSASPTTGGRRFRCLPNRACRCSARRSTRIDIVGTHRRAAGVTGLALSVAFPFVAHDNGMARVGSDGQSLDARIGDRAREVIRRHRRPVRCGWRADRRAERHSSRPRDPHATGRRCRRSSRWTRCCSSSIAADDGRHRRRSTAGAGEQPATRLLFGSLVADRIRSHRLVCWQCRVNGRANSPQLSMSSVHSILTMH